MAKLLLLLTWVLRVKEGKESMKHNNWSDRLQQPQNLESIGFGLHNSIHGPENESFIYLFTSRHNYC